MRGLLSKIERTLKTRSFWLTTAKVLSVALVFVLFSVFMLKQYSFAYPSHDDYGYATLSYVYWEDGMYGQEFSMQQLVHYLTMHYNRWGGRVLSFGQEILLLKAGTDTARTFHAFAIVGIMLMCFLLAYHSKKVKHPVLIALLTVLLFGFFEQSMAISGFYWYCAAILYTVPVLYVFFGGWLLYTLITGKRVFTVAKILMAPFTVVIFFFAGFSMEQVGIFAVVVAATLTVYSTFIRRNLLVLVYALPALLSSIIGCHVMLLAVGNNTRRTLYPEYYALPFIKQLTTSATQIVQTVFSEGDLAMVLLVAVTAIMAGWFLIRRNKKNIASWILFVVTSLGAIASAVISYFNWRGDTYTILLWAYLVLYAVTVSAWLLYRKEDFLIWTLFFGGLASQGACLIAPIYPTRCMIMFAFTTVLLAARMFCEVFSRREGLGRVRRVLTLAGVVIPVAVIGLTGALDIYNGFQDNLRVQKYNDERLAMTGIKNDEYAIQDEQIELMRLKDDKYAGSTQPYGRDLIKDWMKIYYKLPGGLTYEDFVYEEYDEERLEELEQQLADEKMKFGLS